MEIATLLVAAAAMYGLGYLFGYGAGWKSCALMELVKRAERAADDLHKLNEDPQP